MELSRTQRTWVAIAAGFLVLAAFGGVGALLDARDGGLEDTEQTMGESIASLGGLIAAVVVGVSIFRNAHWLHAVWDHGARLVVGVVLVVVGVGALGYLVLDTALYVKNGESPLTGEGGQYGGGTHGQVLFIGFAAAVALAGAGYWLARGRWPDT